jgi:hypothetical protein
MANIGLLTGADETTGVGGVGEDRARAGVQAAAGKATSNAPNIQGMRKTDAAARRFADRERDRIAYPLPLVMPVAEADRWYRGRDLVPDHVAYSLLLVMSCGICTDRT